MEARAVHRDPFAVVASSSVASVVVAVDPVLGDVAVVSETVVVVVIEDFLVLGVGTFAEDSAAVASEAFASCSVVAMVVGQALVVDLIAAAVVVAVVVPGHYLVPGQALLRLRWSFDCPSVGEGEDLHLRLIVDFAGSSFAELVGQPLADTVAVEELGNSHQLVDRLRSLADMLHCSEVVRSRAEMRIEDIQRHLMVVVVVVGMRQWFEGHWVVKRWVVMRSWKALPKEEAVVDLSNRKALGDSALL